VPPPADPSLSGVIAAYLQGVDAGQTPDRDELLRRHPDLADELRRFFGDQDQLDRLARPLRAAAEESDNEAALLPALPFLSAPGAGDRVSYFGDYELLDVIARGGMGVVFKARQISLNRLVAIKMILSGRLAEPAEVERFRREAGAAAQLDHPNIVPIYEVGEYKGHHYYSMKLIEGDNLAAEMPRFTADPRAAALLVAKIARAVQHAHEHGILHRDIKPGNILLDVRKEPHVTDFGLARRLDESSSLSASGAVIGTVSYMAPEQATAQCRRLTSAADVYALGAVLYEMLTGRPPFRTPNVAQTLRDVAEREPERPRKFNRRIPRDLEVICLKCLDKRPHRRYASAAALADDLERCVTGRPIKGRTVSRLERLWMWCRRRPSAVALSAALILLVVLSAGAVGLLLMGPRQPTTPPPQVPYSKLVPLACAFLRDGNLDAARNKLEECAPTDRQIEWRYLYARATDPIFDGFTKGGTQVRQVGFSADASRVVILEDNELKVLRASDDKVVKSFQGTIGGVPLSLITSISIDGDGSHIGLATAENVYVCSLDTGAEVFHKVVPGNDKAWAVALSPDSRRFAASFSNGGMTLWDTSSGESLFCGPSTCFSMAFSPDGSRLAMAGGLEDLVIDTKTGKELLKIKDDEYLSYKVQKTDKGIDEKTGQPSTNMNIKSHGCLSFSADGRRILVSSFPNGGTILIDARTGEVQLRLPRTAKAAAITPDGKRLILVGGGFPLSKWSFPQEYGLEEYGLLPGGNFTVWVGDAITGDEIANIPIPVEDPASRKCRAAISPDCERIGVFFEDANPWWFTATRPQHILSRPYTLGESRAIAVSPDGRFVTAGFNLYDADTFKLIRSCQGGMPARNLPRFGDVSQHGVECVAFSPDSKTLVALGSLGTLRTWNVSTGEILQTIQTVDEDSALSFSPHMGMSFNPDGRRLATPGAHNVVKVWDVATGAEVLSLPHAGPVSSAIFRPDGQRILSFEEDHLMGHLKEWDAASGKFIRESKIEVNRVFDLIALYYRGDSLRVVTEPANWDHRVPNTVVWDGDTGREICGLNTYPCSKAISPDGKRLVTSDEYGVTGRVWDLETGRELMHFNSERPYGAISVTYRWVAFSADGNRVFRCEDALTVWDVSTMP
jgi:WD40 repeat protein/tRNA A-37 threonylcarbamoyl transferase component Bud32